MDKYVAKKITVDVSNQNLTIKWTDNHESVFPLEGLRKACPCVTCVGGHENMGKPVDPELFIQEPERHWEINGINPIGNYAIQINWSDGHNSGIYRWERLREMCPCKECHPELWDEK
jgi:DUF971 family protein